LPRHSVSVREAGPADLPVLLSFSSELRDVASRRGALRAGNGASTAPLRERYAELLADPTRRVVLAVDSEDTLGMAIFSRGTASALLDLPAVQMTHVVVADRHRRQGAGRALVAAAASYAEEIGVEHVVVGVSPNAREANRFYARLGFAPLVVRRVAPLAALRRSLALPDAVTDLRGSLPRRRSLRAGTAAVTRPRVQRMQVDEPGIG